MRMIGHGETDMSHVSTGIYYLRIKYAGKYYTEKIVVVR